MNNEITASLHCEENPHDAVDSCCESFNWGLLCVDFYVF